VERREIFADEADREEFLGRLERACDGGAARVLAWSLMPNHVHLAIRTGARPLAGTMRRLLTGYAMAFNRRHGRAGHLFQGRYKTTVVEEERYLLALVRYIHLNPVRAGLVEGVEALAIHPWAGHAALMGGGSRGFQAVDEVLGLFGSRASEARLELRAFMGDRAAADEDAPRMRGGGLVRSVGGREKLASLREDVSRGRAEPLLYDPRVLGGGEMVAALLAEEENRLGAMVMTAESRREALGRLLESVSRASGLAREELCGPGRRREVVRARRVAAHLAVRRLGSSAAEAGRALGQTVPAVLLGVAEGARLLGELGWDEEALLA
jgi:REP element-mobilizing transposase RayT